MTALRPLTVAAVAFSLACAQTQNVEAKAEIIYEENVPSSTDGGSGPQTASADGLQPPTFRLPAGVRPIRYQAELTVVPTAETFQGVIEIELELQAPQQLLWLNASQLEITAADIKVKDQVIPARVVSSNEDFIGLQLNAPVGPGRATFRARYTGKQSDREVQGAFRQQEGGDWFVFTHFEPFHAREVFPCFDEPQFKVPWELTLQVRRGDLAVANGPQEAETPGPDGMKRVKFKPVTLPSYLVAFAVGPFETLDTPPLGVSKRPGRILFAKGKSAQARYAAQATAELLSQLESYFGMAYPYQKLDTVAVPLFGGAMENAGLITYSQGLLLAPPDQDSSLRQRSFASVQAHELAHMWFGDLVTMKWWDDTWLKESFSDWMAAKVLASWKPEWRSEVGQVSLRSQAMHSDSLVAARAIHPEIQNKEDILGAFDFGITYLKGDAVLTMLEAWVGPEQYRAGIRDYLKRYAWKNADAQDYFAALSRAAGLDVTPVFSSFIDQPGVPLITARLECQGGPRVLLSQRRYFPLGSRGGEAAQQWKVPVCVRFGVGKESARQCTLLEGAEGVLPLTGIKGCPDWIYPNENQAGYYRSRLPAEQVKAVLDAGVLSPSEQVGLVGDLFALMRSGDMAAAEVLQLVPRLANSDSRHVVVAAAEVLAAVERELVPEEQRAHFQRFVNKTFGPRARKLGLTPRKKEDEEQRLLRPALIGLVADEGGDRKLQAEAVAQARRWLTQRGAVSPDMVGTVLNTAGRNADPALYEQLLTAARTTPDRRERQLLLGALGVVEDPALSLRSLELIKSGQFDIREAYTLLWGATEHPATRQQAYDFVKANWALLMAQVPKQNQAYLAALPGGFCDLQHRDDAEAFFQPKMVTIPGGERALQKTLERMDLCVAAREKQSPSVAQFLRAY
ncbi:MAG: ERAP1-like C-terminal domain-containing protein [Myxococcota bacterium]|nr:ERAP1-like C-terminal domain-containing protein [Myxococcota bacterium]